MGLLQCNRKTKQHMYEICAVKSITHVYDAMLCFLPPGPQRI